MDQARLDAIIESHRAGNGSGGAAGSGAATDPNRRPWGGALISILADIQKEFSHLPREALQRVAERMQLPESQVFSVATFYKIFSLKPRGKHSVKVCRGTACHVKGASLILERLKRDLGVEEGDTTPDGRFLLESVRCVGCCSIAPVVVVDETVHGRVAQGKLPEILRKHAGGKD